MWLVRRAHSAGIFQPEDVDLLRKLVTETLPDGADEAEREIHAAAVIGLFKAGITDEQGIRGAMSGNE